MNDTLNIVGGIPDDPRVKEALENYQKGSQDDITKVFTKGPLRGLEKYGVTLRKPSLQHSALLTQIVTLKKDIPANYQAFIYIWTLGAPLENVYEGIETLEHGSFAKFMAGIHGWFDACGIPAEDANSVLEAISEEFGLASKLAGVGDSKEEEGLKKNTPPGTL